MSLALHNPQHINYHENIEIIMGVSNHTAATTAAHPTTTQDPGLDCMTESCTDSKYKLISNYLVT